MKHVESNDYSFMQHHERKTRHWLFLQEGLGQTKNSKGTCITHTKKKGTNKLRTVQTQIINVVS